MDSTNNIRKSFIVLKEMLTDQKVNIDNLLTISDNELDSLYNQNDNIFHIDVNANMKVIYYMNTKFKIQELRKFLQPFGNEQITDIVLIFKEKINNFNSKNIEEFKNINLQIFLMKELLFNISKHCLVPKHEVINDAQEINMLVAQYNLKSKLQFPTILKSDPMSRYLNIQTGNLVKITRISPSAGESILYRCCV
jgi:DNA-directed RNA polymerase I, II, and III subunit RPABC1